MASLTELLRQWRDDLAGWAIPEHITSAVTESPWVLPRDVFARRADRLRRAPGGPSYDLERAVLDPPGSVLDVGAGAGAACLPLAGRTTALTVVDTDDGMLGLLADRARAAGLDPRLLQGRWPDVAGQADPGRPGHLPPCAVQRAGPGPVHRGAHPACAPAGGRRTHRQASADFPQPVVAALPRPGAAGGAGRRPTSWPSWTRWVFGQGTLNGIVRLRPITATGSELVETTRRRLCLPPERASDVEAALREAGHLGQPLDLGTSGRSVVTIWWEGSA